MAIIYSNPTGTVITSFAMDETLPASQPSDLLQVRVSNDIVTAGNGQIGDGTYGVGNSYVGRLGIINLGGTEHHRMCVGETDEGTTFLLDFNEPFDTQPVGSTDTIHFSYEIADIEDGSESGGITFDNVLQIFKFTNQFVVASGGGMQNSFGVAVQMQDDGNNIVFTGESGSHFYSGYVASGRAVDGGLFIAINNVDGEVSMQFQSGSEARMYAPIYWSRENTTQFECAAGSDVLMQSPTFIAGTEELLLYDTTVINLAGQGRGNSTEICRVNDGTSCDGMNLSRMNSLDSAADTTTEIITLRGVLFGGAVLTVRNNKTFNLDNPIWLVTLYSEIDDSLVTGDAEVYDRRTVDLIVQESDGTLLENALAIVYENTVDDVVLEIASDSNGVAAGAFNLYEHEWLTGSGSTTTRSGHSLRIDKWLYFPFIASQVSTDVIVGSRVISTDDNIVQTNQTTALTDGLGIAWNEDTNSSSVIEFTGGSGGTIGLAVGDTITDGTTGATGIVTEITVGDDVAGTIHLRARDTTAFSVGTATIDNGVDGWTATLTASSEQRFAIWLDAITLSYQVQHDYWAALSAAAGGLSATGKLLHSWGRDQQERVLYKSGSNFYTERAYGKGVFIIKGGAGSVLHFTNDAGGTWVPPATVTLQVTVTNQLGAGTEGIKVRYEESDGTLIANGTTNGSGVFSYGIAASLLPYTDAKIVVRDKRFEDPPDTILNITTAGFDLVIGLSPDFDINLP